MTRHPFILLLLLSPVFANASNQSRSCGLAYQMQQTGLPKDIAVKADRITEDVTTLAMNWWAARLSTPQQPITWHIVESLDECMIYIRHGWECMMPKRSVLGITHMPDHREYDGVATVSALSAWVVAHEIGHLIGCTHGPGVMRANHTPGDERLCIDDDALHFALLIRARAAGLRNDASLRPIRKQKTGSS